jgi:hypothetical protein
MNPYPNPQFPLVTEDWDPSGATYYTYSDAFFPYAIDYVVREPDDPANYGLISVIGLLRITRRRR